MKLTIAAGETYCVRLFDTSLSSVASPEFCGGSPSFAGGPQTVGLTGLTLSSGLTLYVVQENQVSAEDSGQIWEAYVDINW